MLTELAEASARLAPIAEAVDDYFYTAERVGDSALRLVYQGRGRDVMLGRIGRRSDDAESWLARDPPRRPRARPGARSGGAAATARSSTGSSARTAARAGCGTATGPARDESGRLFFDGVISDITERRLAADELAAARDQAERRSRTDELTGVATGATSPSA